MTSRWVDESASTEVRELLASTTLVQTPAPTGSGPGAATTGSLVGKIGAVVVAAGLVAGGVIVGRRTASTPAPAPTSPPQPALQIPVPLPPSPQAAAVLPVPLAPVAPAPARSAPPTRPSRPQAPTPPPLDEDADYELLRQAMQSTSAEAKLALAQEHERRFPRSAMAQEREVLAIDALVKLGRNDEARVRLRAFTKTWPTSAHLVRLEHLVGK